MLIPRVSYFPLVYDKLEKLYGRAAKQEPSDEIWLSSEAVALKWSALEKKGEGWRGGDSLCSKAAVWEAALSVYVSCKLHSTVCETERAIEIAVVGAGNSAT